MSVADVCKEAGLPGGEGEGLEQSTPLPDATGSFRAGQAVEGILSGIDVCKEVTHLFRGEGGGRGSGEATHLPTRPGHPVLFPG